MGLLLGPGHCHGQCPFPSADILCLLATLRDEATAWLDQKGPLRPQVLVWRNLLFALCCEADEGFLPALPRLSEAGHPWPTTRGVRKPPSFGSPSGRQPTNTTSSQPHLSELSPFREPGPPGKDDFSVFRAGSTSSWTTPYWTGQIPCAP